MLHASQVHTVIAPMSTARAHHTALRLPNGDVVVTGGTTLAGPTVEVERFSLAEQQWATLERKESALSGQLTVTLDNGHILLVGGAQDGDASNHAERFDPVHITWTTVRPLNDARFSHTATSLWGGAGKVLVVGGNRLKGGVGTVLDTVELYAADSDTWTRLGALSQARMNHSATLLDSGKVLIVGGYGSNQALTHCELFNPGTERFEPAAPLPAARMQHTATLLSNGLVMIAGGAAVPFGQEQPDTYLYDPVQDAWRSGAPMQRGHKGHTATLLPGGKLLVAGHTSLPYRPSLELYDPGEDAWVLQGELSELRFAHTATLLPGTQGVLLCGGQLLMSDTAYSAGCERHGGQSDIVAGSVQGVCAAPADAVENCFLHQQYQTY